jgi:hypothetical protein
MSGAATSYGQEHTRMSCHVVVWIEPVHLIVDNLGTLVFKGMPLLLGSFAGLPSWGCHF